MNADEQHPVERGFIYSRCAAGGGENKKAASRGLSKTIARMDATLVDAFNGTEWKVDDHADARMRWVASRLDQMGAMELVDLTRAGVARTPKEKQQKDVTVLDLFENAATAPGRREGLDRLPAPNAVQRSLADRQRVVGIETRSKATPLIDRAIATGSNSSAVSLQR